ncbi:MAG TPA: hypothetical protein VNS49_09745 [Streptomyces sp.]|nr:hypothetical protein [Streptomyces sp.]
MTTHEMTAKAEAPTEVEEAPDEDLVTKDRHQSINPAGDPVEPAEELTDEDIRVMDRHQSSEPAD